MYTTPPISNLIENAHRFPLHDAYTGPFLRAECDARKFQSSFDRLVIKPKATDLALITLNHPPLGCDNEECSNNFDITRPYLNNRFILQRLFKSVNFLVVGTKFPDICQNLIVFNL